MSTIFSSKRRETSGCAVLSVGEAVENSSLLLVIVKLIKLKICETFSNSFLAKKTNCKLISVCYNFFVRM
jgi:hypothetical protein